LEAIAWRHGIRIRRENETDVKPEIYVEGIKDVVVAASPNGILVCSKEYSEEIKKTAENLTSYV
jgi:hypothetical protein